MRNSYKSITGLAAALGLAAGCGGQSEQEIRSAIAEVDAIMAKQQRSSKGYQNLEELGKLKSELERQLGEITAAKAD